MNRLNQTRFISKNDLANNLTEINFATNGMAHEIEAGGIPLLKMEDKLYIDTNDNHSIVFGATGSKKTRNFVMPMVEVLTRSGESFIAVDPKGEIYEYTKEDAKKRGYNVTCINLRDFNSSESWNPLMIPYLLYHNGEKSRALSMVNEIACMLIGNEDNQDKFWTYSAREIIVGFIMILFERSNLENCTLRNFLTLWNIYLTDKKETKNMIKTECAGTIVMTKLGILFSDSDKTSGSAEAVVNGSLNKLLVNEEEIDFLSKQGLDLREIVEGNQAVYIIVPDENIYYHFIASLLISQYYDILINSAQRNEGKSLKNRVNFILDEFANMPQINNISQMISASRSRNIRFTIIVQSWNQLTKRYQEEAEVICSNCNNWIYLYSKEYELLEKISNLCGTVIYENHITMPLFSEYDLQHLNKEEGEALLLIGRLEPCITNLIDIAEYK